MFVDLWLQEKATISELIESSYEYFRPQDRVKHLCRFFSKGGFAGSSANCSLDCYGGYVGLLTNKSPNKEMGIPDKSKKIELFIFFNSLSVFEVDFSSEGAS